MDLKRVLAYLAIVVVVTCIALATIAPRDAHRDIEKYVSVELLVFEGGKVVRVSSDPLTRNFFVLVSNYFLGQLSTAHGSAISASGKSYDTFYTLSYDSYGNSYAHPPQIQLCIGNGTGTASFSDTKLFSEVACLTLSSSNVVVNDTGTSIVIYYRAVFNLTTPTNVTEAGLYLYSGWFSDRVLIAHDTFAPVLANTSIGIEYIVSISYSEPPFTKSFWELIANNYLGLSSVGLGFTSVPSVDLANTRVSLKVGVNNASSVAWSPTISLTSVAYLEPPLSTHYTIAAPGVELDLSYSPPSTVGSYGLAIYLRVDTNIENGESTTSYSDILIAYVPFQQLTTLDPTKFVTVTLRVYQA